jgi:hypothetical protein
LSRLTPKFLGKVHGTTGHRVHVHQKTSLSLSNFTTSIHTVAALMQLSSFARTVAGEHLNGTLMQKHLSVSCLITQFTLEGIGKP